MVWRDQHWSILLWFAAVMQISVPDGQNTQLFVLHLFLKYYNCNLPYTLVGAET